MLDNETLIRELTKALNKANESAQRVRKLHKPIKGNFFGQERLECAGCFTVEESFTGDYFKMHYAYPCPTIKALDGEQ